MFQHQGIWLPDGEKHFVDWMNSSGEIVDGKGTYQIKKLRAALEHCTRWRTAIDVGAHVGFWSMHLARRFQNVFAYEPVREFRECFLRNVDPDDWEARALDEGWGRGGSACNVELFPYAVGRTGGGVRMTINQADTGGTHVGGMGEIPMVKLDDQFLHDPDAVSFLKIDCEGYEHYVIAGAEKLIRAAKPCIIVEQKQHIMGKNYGIKGTPAVDLLKEMGYKVVREISGDYILTA